MLIFAHLAAGWLIGKLTGHVLLSLLVSVLIDIDHTLSYVRNGIFGSYRKFIEAMTASDDPYGDQRHGLHTLLAWGIISALCAALLPQYALTISAAYLVHLLLDMLDDADMTPLLPWNVNVRGPIPYNSWPEYLLTLIVALVAFLL